MSCDPEHLWHEACALHRAVFGFEAPKQVGQRYVEAHGFVLSRMDATDSNWMQRVLDIRADLEALELVLRIRQPGHVLCHKFKLLIYIAEAFPEYYCYFVNEDRHRFRAFFRLTLNGFRSLYKYFKGWFLLRTLVK